MIDGNHLLFGQGGHAARRGRPASSPRPPVYDHCNMTVVDDRAGRGGRRRSASCCSAMSYADPEVRPLLDLEGLHAVGAGTHERLRRCSSGRRRGRLLRRADGDRREYRRDAGLVDLGRPRPRVRPGRPPARRPRPAPIAGRRTRSSVTGRDPALGRPPAGVGRGTRPRVRRAVDRRPLVARPRLGRRRPLGRRRAGRRSGRGRHRRPAARAVGPRRARRAGRGGRARTGRFDLDDRDVVWADLAPRLYAQAAAAQWDPATAVDWDATRTSVPRRRRGRRRAGHDLPRRERAGRPGRAGPASSPASTRTSARSCSCSPCRPPTRPATSRCSPGAPCCTAAELGTSAAGGRASLQTLLAEPDFSLATFLLSVLGEGSFLDAARVPRTPRTRPGDRGGSPTSRAGRGAPRRVRHGPPRAPGVGCDPTLRGTAARGHRAPPRRARRHRGAERRRLRRARRAGRRRLDTRTRSRRVTTRCRRCSTTWTTAAGDASSASASRRRGRRALRPAHPQLHVTAAREPS